MASPYHVLPELTDEGLLPFGDYELTLEELLASRLVLGPDLGSPRWDMPWRRRLVENAGVLIGQLARVRITEVFLGGSFVEDKGHPNDIDGYFPFPGGAGKLRNLVDALNELDPHRSWGWDPRTRTKHRGYPKAQLPMWHAYRVELYPHYGQPFGLSDRDGNPLDFPAAFRQSRDGRPRGILKIRGAP
jgi:hypothetical protein